MTLTPNGSSFTTKYGWNLLASDDEWSAPIDAQVGPDGHMWVIDWYAFIVQHNPTPPGFKNGKGNAYETELRDKKHGRIYRVVYTKAKPEKPFTLKDATPEQLVEALKHPNMKWRLHAQRLLVERGKADVTDALVKMVADETVDETGLNAGAVHALRTLHGLGLFQRGGEGGGLIHAKPFTHLVTQRSSAARLSAVHAIPELVATRVFRDVALNDPSPHVRIGALLAMTDARAHGALSENSVNLAALLHRDDLLKDLNLRDALTIAVASDLGVIRSVLLDRAALSSDALRIVELAVATAAKEKKLNHFLVDAEFFKLFASAEPVTANAVANGLTAGWPKDHVLTLPPAAQEALTELVTKLPASARGKMVKLAMAWGVKGVADRFGPIIDGLLKSVGDEKTADKERIEAAKQIIEFRTDDDNAVSKILDALSARSSPELAAGLLEALGGSQAPSLGKALVAKLGDLSPSARTNAMRLLLSRTAATRALLGAVEKGQFDITELSLEQRQALSSHSDKTISTLARKLLAKGGGLPSADRQKVIDEMLDATKKKGDADLGKVVFKNQCAKCHVHGSEGTRIGPDLTGMAVHSKEHLLIDILDPSRSVEGNFRVWRVTTLDGKTFNGLLTSETKTSIEIVDAEAKKQNIQRDDIEELRLDEVAHA